MYPVYFSVRDGGGNAEPDTMNVIVKITYAMVCSAVVTEQEDVLLTAGHCVAKKMGQKRGICKNEV